MAAHVASPAEIAQEERRYIQVFIWLAVLTALEIGLTYLPLSRLVIGTGLVLLATSKAAMVALYYMHLVHEKRTLTYIALTPAILCAFLVLMLLPDLGAITRLLVTAIEHGGGGAAAH
jgi:cytochrome c oxidase subunit 4